MQMEWDLTVKTKNFAREIVLVGAVLAEESGRKGIVCSLGTEYSNLQCQQSIHPRL